MKKLNLDDGIPLGSYSAGEMLLCGYMTRSDQSRVVSFRSGTRAVDRHNTVIVPTGIRTENFDRNPVFLWAHGGQRSPFGPPPVMDHILGKVISHRASPEAFDVDVEFAAEEVNPFAHRALMMVKAGFLRATSIAFLPKKWHDEEREAVPQDPCGDREDFVRVFDEVELLEVSLVPIPSNPEAVRMIRAIADQVASPTRWEWAAAVEGWKDLDPAAGYRTTTGRPPDTTTALARMTGMEDYLPETLELDRGVIPPDVSKEKAAEGESWSKPGLGDFTKKTWAELSDEEKKRIAGHYAWSPAAVPESFGGLKLPHHRASDGAVVWKGVAAAMAALKGARGGVEGIPGEDRQRVWSHLAAHYKQFNKIPPDRAGFNLEEGDLRHLDDQPPPEGADLGSAREAVSSALARWKIRSALHNLTPRRGKP